MAWKDLISPNKLYALSRHLTSATYAMICFGLPSLLAELFFSTPVLFFLHVVEGVGIVVFSVVLLIQLVFEILEEDGDGRFNQINFLVA